MSREKDATPPPDVVGVQQQSAVVPWKTRAVVMVGIGAPLGVIAVADPLAADQLGISDEPIVLSFVDNIDGKDFQPELTPLQSGGGFVVGGTADEVAVESDFELSWGEVQALPEVERSAYLIAGDRSEPQANVQHFALLSDLETMESPAGIRDALRAPGDPPLGSFDDILPGSGFAIDIKPAVESDDVGSKVAENAALVSLPANFEAEDVEPHLTTLENESELAIGGPLAESTQLPRPGLSLAQAQQLPDFEAQSHVAADGGEFLKVTHTFLAGTGLALGFGIIPDGVDAALYGIEGIVTGDQEKFVQMGISIGAMLPLGGQAVGVTRLAVQAAPTVALKAAKAPKSAAIRTSEQAAAGTLAVGLGAAAIVKHDQDAQVGIPGFAATDEDKIGGDMPGHSAAPVEPLADTGQSFPDTARTFAPSGFQPVEADDGRLTQPAANPTDWREQILASTTGSSGRGSGDGARDSDGVESAQSQASAEEESFSDAVLNELTLEELEVMLARAVEDHAKFRDIQADAFKLYGRRWVDIHRKSLFEAGDNLLVAEKRLQTVRQVRDRKAQQSGSAVAEDSRSFSFAESSDAGHQLAELWDDYKLAAEEHAQHRQSQRLAFAVISTGIQAVRQVNLEEILPVSYDTYMDRTATARARMEDVERLYRSQIEGFDSDAEQESAGASFTYTEAELWAQFRTAHHDTIELERAIQVSADRSRRELELKLDDAEDLREKSQVGMERSLSSLPTLPAFRETIDIGNGGRVIRTGQGTVVKLLPRYQVAVATPASEVIRNGGDDAIDKVALAERWQRALTEEEYTDRLAVKFVDLHTRARETAEDSNGNRIGHLIPEHRLRPDVRGGYEIAEIPIGEPDYLNARALSPAAYVKAFESLLPVFVGLEKQGILTDPHPDNVTFDEQGRITAIYDLAPGSGKIPLEMPSEAQMSGALTAYFTFRVNQDSKRALYEHLGLLDEDGSFMEKVVKEARQKFFEALRY